MSELTNFANSLKRGEILLPLLKQFLEKQKRREDKGLISKKAWVIEDAQMTILCICLKGNRKVGVGKGCMGTKWMSET